MHKMQELTAAIDDAAAVERMLSQVLCTGPSTVVPAQVRTAALALRAIRAQLGGVVVANTREGS